jgi:hypothetical protein
MREFLVYFDLKNVAVELLVIALALVLLRKAMARS